MFHLTPLPRITATVMAVVALASVGARASAKDYITGDLSGDPSAQVDLICKTIIRVQPDEEQYAGCVESLSAALSDVERARAMRQARGKCVEAGLQQASPRLAVCLLSAADPKAEAAAEAASRSYFYASANEVHRREQLSCAGLGLDPAGAPFANCVADLAAALSGSDMPQN